MCVWNVVVLFKYLKRYHIEGQSLFFLVPDCKRYRNGFKVQEGRFQLDFRKMCLNCMNNSIVEIITIGGFLFTKVFK